MKKECIVCYSALFFCSGNMVKLVKSNIKNVRKFVSLFVFLVLLPHNYGFKCGKCGELHKRSIKNV